MSLLYSKHCTPLYLRFAVNLPSFHSNIALFISTRRNTQKDLCGVKCLWRIPWIAFHLPYRERNPYFERIANMAAREYSYCGAYMEHTIYIYCTDDVLLFLYFGWIGSMLLMHVMYIYIYIMNVGKVLYNVWKYMCVCSTIRCGAQHKIGTHNLSFSNFPNI